MFEFLFFLIIIVIICLIVIYSFRFGITPTPSSLKVIKQILTYLDNSEDINFHYVQAVELGSGWGNLVLRIAQKYPYLSVDAYEVSPIPYWISKFFKFILNLNNIVIFREDFFKISLTRYNLVLCYLYPGAMQKLKAKFESELSDGSVIISHTFAIPDWKPLRIIRVDDLYKTPIYVYKVNQKEIKKAKEA